MLEEVSMLLYLSSKKRQEVVMCSAQLIREVGKQSKDSYCPFLLPNPVKAW